jgi:hypothetical protein
MQSEAISLYLELNPGQKPDFEVVGLAAAAFAEAVKEIAYILDPGMEVRLEFDSTTESSLSLNALFKTLRTREGQAATAIGVVIGTSIAFVGDVRQWTVAKLMDHLFPTEQTRQLSTEDINRIAQACKNVADGKVAKQAIQKVYKQLDRDDAVVSVGTVTKPHTKPPDPVPHSEFQTRAGILRLVQTSPLDRMTPSTERLTLISPVLLPADRVWHFQSPFGEFSYHVRDEKFVQDTLQGRNHLTLRAGIQITAKIETFEKFEGGVWVPTQRDIVKVMRIHKSRKQADLFSQQTKKPKARKKKKR